MVKKAISQIGNQIKNCKCVRDFCFLCSTQESGEAVKMPLSRLVLGPFAIVIDYIKTFFVIGGAYALAQTLLAVLLGFTYVCLYGIEDVGLIYCSASNAVYLVYSILKFVLLAMFLIVWGRTVWGKNPLDLKKIFMPGKGIPSTLLTMVVFLFLNMIPMVSYYILYQREPNPDWIVEIFFFGIVSLGFLVPFLLMRFYSVFAFVVSGEKLPPFKIIWDKNSGNMLKMITALFLILLLAIFVMVNFFFNFRAAAAENVAYIGIISEFLYNILSLLVFTLFVNHCFIQKDILFGGKQDESKSNN